LARADSRGFRVLETAACVLGTDDPALQLQLRDRDKVRFTKNGHDGTITIPRVTCEGMLEVTGPDAHRHALTSGISHAGAYGCGLLTFAKPALASR
jgi:CRISPR system Cascade subunit CasE